MLTTSGTHCTRVGSPSLQISGDCVTPVVAYPSGHVPQVILVLFGSAPSCATLMSGNAATRAIPINTLHIKRLAAFLIVNGIILPPCKLLEAFANELLQ